LSSHSYAWIVNDSLLFQHTPMATIGQKRNATAAESESVTSTNSEIHPTSGEAEYSNEIPRPAKVAKQVRWF